LVIELAIDSSEVQGAYCNASTLLLPGFTHLHRIALLISGTL